MTAAPRAVTNGGVLRSATLLLAVLAILASGPAHEWLHGGNLAPLFEGVELHGEDCDHFPDVHVHAADCGVCVAARVALATPRPTAMLVERPAAVAPQDAPASAPLRHWSIHVLGSRAPPANG